MNIKYAHVITDLQLKSDVQIYTYIIPEDMLNSISPGISVLVPFGNRQVTGYVVGISSEPPGSEVKLKSIAHVFSEDRWINEDLISLARWMAHYYMCPLGTALKCILPGGITRKRTLVVSLKEGYEKIKENLKSEKLIEIFRSILKNGSAVQISDLSEATKVPLDTLKRHLFSLKEAGLVKIDEAFLQPKARPKIIQKVRLNLSPEELSTRLETLEKKSPGQAMVLKFLQEENRILTMTELMKASGVTSSVIRALREKGYIKLEDIELRRNPLISECIVKSEMPSYKLTSEQERALKSIVKSIEDREYRAFLLYGITGSGKTEVYLQAIARTLEMNRQAIMLVPEISLTPQTVERFYTRFGEKIAVLHSRLSEGERYDEWRRLRDGHAFIVIGARSAVFAPLTNPGLIVVDEEHETSYKQDNPPRYHIRELAVERAKLAGATLIFGSATPSVETFYMARENKFNLFSLPFRVEGRPLPVIEVVNMSDELKQGNRTIFSYALQRAIWECLDKNEKIILFLNRRGHSTFVLCRDCGHVLKCEACSVSLNYHSDTRVLTCHYCNYSCRTPMICPSCKGKRIKYFGTGTQKVEMEVNRFFPEAKTIRMDSDTTVRKGSHRALLESFQKEDKSILIGTQMIAKGLDIPEVTLIGVITADTAINLPDFRAGERTFQLLTQVAGRAGRGNIPGRVILQTYSPEHPSVITAKDHDYESFYEREIKEREDLGYPPFASLIRLVFTGRDEKIVRMTAEEISYKLRELIKIPDGMLLGPSEAPLSRIKENYRWHVIIKGENLNYIRDNVRTVMKSFHSNIRISIDVNPLEMM